METPQVVDITKRNKYKFKKHPFISMENNPEGAFSQTPFGVLHVEDIRTYIHCKFESIGDLEIMKEMNEVLDDQGVLKVEFTNLDNCRLITYMEQHEFSNAEWVRIVLS